MKILIVSDQNSWFQGFMDDFVAFLCEQSSDVSIDTTFDIESVQQPYDVCVLICVTTIIAPDILDRFAHALVLHGSELPQGRGMSPVSWQILEGKNTIAMSLIAAQEHVDTGDIFGQVMMAFEGHELLSEIRKKQVDACKTLLSTFIRQFPNDLQPQKQIGPSTYYKKRTPADSRLDPNKTIKEQFNLMRIADNDLYPLHFTLQNQEYELKIIKKERT